jgi:hypothetical protein
VATTATTSQAAAASIPTRSMLAPELKQRRACLARQSAASLSASPPRTSQPTTQTTPHATRIRRNVNIGAVSGGALTAI